MYPDLKKWRVKKSTFELINYTKRKALQYFDILVFSVTTASVYQSFTSKQLLLQKHLCGH